MLEEIRDGGKRALAAALVRMESAPDAPETAALLDEAFAAPVGTALGLTGPPGVGKSTLIDALIREFRRQGKTVAVIAVDPSSARSGGALMGDRTRFTTDPADQGVFVRSMAARDRLGGVSGLTYPAMVLMRALYDFVIVETVGVGQSETEIAAIADLVVFCAQPGSGDALQYMKAGIMEVPDLVVVTKADMGRVARQTAQDLKGALSLGGAAATVPVLTAAATTGDGIGDLVQEICTHSAKNMPRFAYRRPHQLSAWGEAHIRTRFGTQGLQILQHCVVDNSEDSTFTGILSLESRLSAALTAAFQ